LPGQLSWRLVELKNKKPNMLGSVDISHR
jgi:hypothetical protein